MPWFYAVGGQQKGPVSDDEFNQLVTAGVVKSDTLVWREGWPNWRAYGTSGAGAPAGVPVAAGVEDADTAVCAVSGRRRPKSEMLQFEGRWVSAEHKDEFFQRLREGVVQSGDFVYAGFWKRFVAKFVDGIILWVVNFLVAMVLGLVSAQSESPAVALTMGVLIQVAGLAIGIFYTVFFIRKYDATPGKLAMKLKVVRPDGAKLSVGRIIGRYFAEILSSLILLIGYLMVAFDKEERRALHDRIADTRVIIKN